MDRGGLGDVDRLRWRRRPLPRWKPGGRKDCGAFAKAHREGVVISDNGRVRLGHALAPLGRSGSSGSGTWRALARGSCWRPPETAARSWAASRSPARTGASSTIAPPAARGLPRDRLPGALARRHAGGISYAGTGPSGQVVNLTDPKHPASRPDPKVQYIWDLACDQQGNLLAATGPNGQLWKRSPRANGRCLYDSKSTHLLCLAVGPDGSIYAGSDGEGLIYRVSQDGKATIVFDAPQSEIRTLLWGGDGALYAGTAAEAGGGNSGRSSMFLAAGGSPHILDSPPRAAMVLFPRAARRRTARSRKRPLEPGPPGGSGQPRPATPGRPGGGGGSAAPRPITAGDNAVYRLDADGVPREVFRFKALVHALAWVDDRLMVGTGPDGQLFEVREAGHETAPIAKLDSGQILSLLAEPDGTVLLGTGDPGTVVRLSPGYAPSGKLVSEIHDTKLVSRFGVLSWRADRPAGTSIAIQSRSGNVGEPDETWSAWSAEQNDPARALTACPARPVHPVSRQAFHQ